MTIWNKIWYIKKNIQILNHHETNFYNIIKVLFNFGT